MITTLVVIMKPDLKLCFSSLHFRGVKIVGPFVIMIYRMITGDLLRFVTIYAIFAMGFSQGKSNQVIVVVIEKAARTLERLVDLLTVQRSFIK